MAAGLAVAALVGGTAALRAGETHTARTSPLPAFPRDLAGWTLAEPAPIRTIDATGETETLTLHYRRDGRDLRVVIVEALSRDAKLSELNLAPPAQELWRDGRRQKHLACAADDCMTLLHTTWQRDQGSLLRHVYFSHVVGRFTTDSTLAFRALQGWRRLVGPAAPSRLIGFVSDETELDAAGLVAATRDLQAALDSSAR
ncbi:MAG: hypothetical protein HY021_11830 [Burkholderiales bacterium]|nr:hypothetical protein [Burkholderiales bacterium]